MTAIPAIPPRGPWVELPPGAAVIGLAEGPLEQLRQGAPELHAHEGPFHEWLLSRFPEGSGGREVHVLRRGGVEEVPRAEWDFVPEPGERIVVYVAPGEPISGTAILTSILISIAASVVLTVISALLFPEPQQPAFAKARKPSTVYSTAFPQNAARLHQAMPVLYGFQTWAPDLAATPYSYFKDNKHYVVVLLLLTCGECDVEGVFAGATNVESLPDGSVRWKAYGPKDHLQRHGVVGEDFGIWEDVVTSVDVAGVELRSSTRDQQITLAADFIAPDTIRLYATGAAVDAFEEGGSIIVSGTGSNNGAFTIGAIDMSGNRTDLDVGSGVTDETGGLTELRSFDGAVARRQGGVQVWYLSETTPAGALALSAGDLVRITAGGVDQYGTVERYSYRVEYDADEGEADGGLHTLRLKNVGGPLKGGSWASATVYKATSPATFDTSGIPRWTGPFQVTKAGQGVNKIEIDLEFPAGLYEADEATGALLADTAQFRFQIQQLDDDGNPTGDWQTTDLSISTGDHLTAGEPLNTRIRLTHTIFTGTGEWRIRGRRTSPESTAAAAQSRCVWTQLKGRRILRPSSQTVYGPVTLLALELEATAGLSQDAIGRIRVAATRLLPKIRDPYNGEELGRSRSPVRAVYDMLTNPHYGLGYDPARIFDLVELRAARVLHSGVGVTFDHLLTDQVSAREAVRLALQPALADMQIYNGKVSIRQEGPKEDRTLLFSPINVIPGTLRINFGFRSVGDPDGVKVVTLDPDSLSERSVVHPVSAARPTELKIYGMHPDFAQDFARVRWQQRKAGRLVAQFSVRGESRLARAGERVGLSWPTFGWGDAARLIAVEETEDGWDLTLDRPVPDIDGGIRWTQLRKADGTVIGPLAMTKSGPRKITLPDDPGIALHVLGGGQEPTHVAIGKGQNFLLDLTVDTVEMDGPGRGKITGRLYLPDAYEGTVFEGLAT